MDALLETLRQTGWPPWIIAGIVVLAFIIRPILACVGIVINLHRPAVPTVATLVDDLKNTLEKRANELEHRAKRAEDKADAAEKKADQMHHDIIGIQALHSACVETVHQLEHKLRKTGR